ncbi:MAG: C39 family peptidase [Minisyncoccia bacterium]
MKLNIPFYSQYSEEVTEEWQSRACAILCLKMVIGFLDKKVDAMDIIKEGLIISNDLSKKGRPQSGYTKEFGWGHDLLVMLLCNRQVFAYKQEFKSFDNGLTENESPIKFGINKIVKNIKEKFPVIISLAKDITNPRLSGHMVVVSGFEEKNGILSGFYINDPEKKTEMDGKDIFVNIEDFVKSWKKLAILTE